MIQCRNGDNICRLSIGQLSDYGLLGKSLPAQPAQEPFTNHEPICGKVYTATFDGFGKCHTNQCNMASVRRKEVQEWGKTTEQPRQDDWHYVIRMGENRLPHHRCHLYLRWARSGVVTKPELIAPPVATPRYCAHRARILST